MDDLCSLAGIVDRLVKSRIFLTAHLIAPWILDGESQIFLWANRGGGWGEGWIPVHPTPIGILVILLLRTLVP
jgi:hypothetical protein